MKKYRLKDNHPFMEKVNKLFVIMDKMGIVIENTGMGLCFVDRENDTTYLLEDIESPYEPIANFPCNSEFKLTFTED
jgi:hypothetical protein